MSGPTQAFVFAAFLIAGVVVFFIGADMNASPSAYAMNKTLIEWLGMVLMAIAFIPAVVMGIYVIRLRAENKQSVAEESPFIPPPAIPVVSAEPEAVIPSSKPSTFSDGMDRDDSLDPHLIGLTGGLPHRIRVQKGVFTIGRGNDCNLVLNSQLVSRRHAQLEWNGEVLLIRDLGSSNATLVNDKKLEREIALNEGDVIQIVDFNLEVEMPISMAKTILRPKSSSHREEPSGKTIRLSSSDEGQG